MENVEAPKPLDLDGNVNENWRRFKQAWEIYLAIKTTGTDKATDEKYKVALLIHTLGEEAREICNSFSWTSEGDEWKVDKIVERFADYCADRDSETIHASRFFTCRQAKGQSIDSYYRELQILAKKCNFAQITDRLLKYQVICGVANPSVQERLFREPNSSTLEKTFKIIRSAEATDKQAKEMSKEEPETVAFVCKTGNRQGAIPRQNAGQSGGSGAKSRSLKSCPKCGLSRKPKAFPAFNKICSRCQNLHHFARMCKLTVRGVNLVEAEGAAKWDTHTDEEFFADTVEKTPVSHFAWTVPMTINLKLDTGANVNIIGYQDFLQLKIRPRLHPSKVKLSAYAGSDVPVKGQCVLQITHKGRIYNVSFIVTPAQVQPILGVKDYERLNLVKRVWAVSGEPKFQDCSVEGNMGLDTQDKGVRCNIDKTKFPEQGTGASCVTSSNALLAEFPDLFEGLGCLPGEHCIVLNESATPVVETCRKVPFALNDKLKVELDRMEKCDAIEKVVEPSEWVNGLVVVHEKDGNLRVCLDPRNLNKDIRREYGFDQQG